MRLLLSSILIFSSAFVPIDGDEVAIVGAGHVGTVMGAIFSHLGHSVTFVDKDEQKIENLKNNILQISEPHLLNYIQQANQRKLLKFSHKIETLENVDVLFVCTETPSLANGKLDCSSVHSVLSSVIKLETLPQLICIKSTLYPGSMEKFSRLFENTNSRVSLVYNPEFMREGSAISDIMNSNPIVIGAESQEGINKALSFYQSFFDQNPQMKVVTTNYETAELIKLAWNGFSAMRITYVNELSRLCKKLNADIFDLVQGFSMSEDMLPTSKVIPGPGFGGSCFPKDTLALSCIFQELGFNDSLVHQTISMNQFHIDTVISEILDFSHLECGDSVAILGFSFKANTEDTRNTPAKNLVQVLKEKGIIVKGYDPNFSESMKKEFPHVTFFSTPYEAIDQTSCLIVLTESDEHRNLDFERISELMKKKKLVDVKNLYDVKTVRHIGFDVLNMGRLKR